MRRFWTSVLAAAQLASVLLAQKPAAEDPMGYSRVPDSRDIRWGHVLPDEGYCDQPYVVRTADGAWLCVMTTGSKHEGAAGQHVVALRSGDHGSTWSNPVDIEPATGPVASWGMPLVTTFGRVYVFYSFNGERVAGRRADMLGWYCYRYSDDGGVSWSKRYRLPLRKTAVDLGNDWKGAVQIFWGVGKPIVVDGAAIFSFTKIGKYMLDQSEGWFFRSANVMTERDVSKIRWELLPDGDRGLRAKVHGSVQSEQNLVSLANGDLYCMYRTTMGYPCHAYSRDGGRTWSPPVAATYSPSGKKFKHPRACPRLWKTKSGRFLFWFHNNGHKDWSPGTRNPCWLAGGIERDGFIHWSQPEIVLYDSKDKVRISYPDLIEEKGRFWITETQKSVARVHVINPALLEGMWTQGQVTEVSDVGRVDARRPKFEDVDAGCGLSLDFSFVAGAGAKSPSVSSASAESSAAGSSAVGFTLVHLRAGTSAVSLEEAGGKLALHVTDGARRKTWTCDAGLLRSGATHHVVLTVDGGPGILTWVVDGVLCDGGATGLRGWARFRGGKAGPSLLGNVLRRVSEHELVRGTSVAAIRIYARALTTSEAVARFTATRRSSAEKRK